MLNPKPIHEYGGNLTVAKQQHDLADMLGVELYICKEDIHPCFIYEFGGKGTADVILIPQPLMRMRDDDALYLHGTSGQVAVAHEIIHATSRKLGRLHMLQSPEEELVAEFGSMMLLGDDPYGYMRRRANEHVMAIVGDEVRDAELADDFELASSLYSVPVFEALDRAEAAARLLGQVEHIAAAREHFTSLI